MRDRGTPMSKLASDPRVEASLNERNACIADFWLADPDHRMQHDPSLKGQRALIVDAEDAFTAMLTQLLAAVGLNVTTRNFNDSAIFEPGWDLTVLGPGPGDPRNAGDRRIASMRHVLAEVLSRKTPLLAVCLSHQLLCLALGLELVRLPSPHQGVQRQIDLFGQLEKVGFYNTYVAKCDTSALLRLEEASIEVSRDPESEYVHALRGAHIASFQFHAESVLTQRGLHLISSNIKRILGV